MPPRVLMVAGEPSGELHGSAVVRALRRLAPGAEIAGVGGSRMRAEGMEVIHDCADLAFMGFAEVVRNLGTIRRLRLELVAELERRRPDVAVLIDYPGFNLRFAAEARARGVPVLYYISPQVWAWHRGRVKKMRALVNRMMVVFPFEVPIYREAGIDVEFVGHPLVEHIGTTATRAEFFRRWNLDPDRPLLGLFPGSRRQEIERILPVMLRSADALRAGRALQVAIGVAPSLGREFIVPYTRGHAPAVLVEEGTYDLMAYAGAAVVTSGTATLETGWFGTPMAVVYRTSPLTYAIGRMLVDVTSIGLVNIVAGRQVVPELIQGNMTPEKIAAAVGPLLDDSALAARMRDALAVVRAKLGGPGASERVARGVLALAGNA
ncbi:MAG TPA: lipid-A-disaccharide synthase [Bacteroidota bacterium]|nr:lipid-A-disaccharide synthase [Bacteroidota bacterium]